MECMELPNYTLLRCPYCKYIWSKRGDFSPVSCPRCKKRFDYPEKTITLEKVEVTSDDIREYLEAANNISIQCKSLDETLDKF
jgi:hypothetical protein